MKGAIELLENGVKMFAAIGVTYPEGSTVTCTNGEKTLKAKTATGQWVFAIPEAGTWTVTATNGTKTKSQSVNITSEGQLESVTLSYGLILFDGADNTAITGGWDIYGHGTTTSDSNGGSDCSIKNDGTLYAAVYRGYGGSTYKVWTLHPENKIDLSEYSTMKCVVSTISNVNDVFSLAAVNSYQTNNSFVSGDPLAQAYITDTGEFSLDISNINKACYPSICVEHNGSANIAMSKIWLE